MVAIASVVVQALISSIAGIVVAVFGASLRGERDRQARVENEIYQPLHNEIHEATQGTVPENCESQWDKFGQHEKMRVREPFRRRMNEYVNKLQELSEVGKDSERWYGWFANELPTKEEEGDSESMVKIEGDNRQLYAWSCTRDASECRDMDRWLDRHLPELDRMDEPLDGEDIESRFHELSEERDWDYSFLYKSWERPDSNLNWGKKIYWAYSETAMREIETNISDVACVRRAIQEQAREIEGYIQDRMNEGSLTAWIHRIQRLLIVRGISRLLSNDTAEEKDGNSSNSSSD